MWYSCYISCLPLHPKCFSNAHCLINIFFKAMSASFFALFRDRGTFASVSDKCNHGLQFELQSIEKEIKDIMK